MLFRSLSVLKLGDRVDAASVVDGGAKATLAMVGSFGVALVRVADDGGKVDTDSDDDCSNSVSCNLLMCLEDVTQ